MASSLSPLPSSRAIHSLISPSPRPTGSQGIFSFGLICLDGTGGRKGVAPKRCSNR